MASLSVEARNAMIDGVTALIDSGSGPGQMLLYNAEMPADADQVVNGVLMATFILNKPSFLPASQGAAVMVIDPPVEAPLLGSSTSPYYIARFTDSDGNPVADEYAGSTGEPIGLIGNGQSATPVLTVTEAAFTSDAGPF